MTVTDRPNVEYGDPEVALPNEVLRSLVGSGVHGMAIDGTDDRDEMGVFIEPARYVIGGRQLDQFVSRTQPEGVPSGPGDTDLTVYSLRKYVRLAVAGNPTILLPLYAPEDALVIRTPLGDELRDLARWIVSQKAGRRFLGYLRQQEERMHGGGKRNRVPARPELVARFGYDVKYASHAIRLGLQGIELWTTGRLTLPLSPPTREVCLGVKRGDVSFTDAAAMIAGNRQALERLVDDPDSTPLRERPDFERVDAWLIHAHRTHWGW